MINKFLRIRISLCLVSATLAYGSIACSSSSNNNANSNVQSSANSDSSSKVKPAPSPTCDSSVDQRINEQLDGVVSTIPDLNRIRRQIHFESKNCTVFLTGWTGNTTLYKEMEKQALNLSALGVIGVDKQEFWVLQTEARLPGCTDGWLPCGDICIPPGQTCQTKKTTGTPTPTP